MPRPRSIDRERLLDLAEQAVASTGAAGLSFGAVAAAAGLSKASVQSVFGTREALIEAMLDRWITQEQKRYASVAGTRPSAKRRVLAHLETTATESADAMRRVATLLAAMAGSPHQAHRAVDWYAARVPNLSATGEEARRLRMAFMAAEGAFYMRYFVGFPISDAVWETLFDDLKRLAEN